MSLDFDRVIELRPKLMRYALRLNRNHVDDAKDLLQATMERAWRFRDRYQEGGLLGWLGTMMYRLHVSPISHPRSVRAVQMPDDAGDWLHQTYPCAGEAYCQLHELAAGIEKLSAGQRASFTLTHVEGMAYADAAKRMGVVVGTVKSQVSRAQEALSA